MIRRIRGIGRATALAGVTLALAGSLAVLFVPTVPFGSAGRRARGILRRLWTPMWSRAALMALGVRVRVSGTPPNAPFLLATNHLGYLDILVLGALRPSVFVAKREVRSWPVWGWLSRLGGTVFVDRTSSRDALRVIDEVTAAIDAGEGVVLFPEGTTSGGPGILPIRPALLETAARMKRPLHYGTLRYRTGPDDPPPADAVCWWGDHEFGPHLFTLLQLDRIEVEVRFGDAPLTHDDRKALAGALSDALEASLGNEEITIGST